MASWHINNFASQPMATENTNHTTHSTFPPITPTRLPVMNMPPINVPPPFLPPYPLQAGFHCQPFSIPPPINTSVPPPPILYPPPVPGGLVGISEGSKVNLVQDDFEKLKEKLKKNYEHVTSPSKAPCKLKISTLKQKLIRWFHLLRKLEGQTNCLQITFKSLPEDEWNHRCKEIENIKAELSEIMASLNNPESLKEMLKIVNKQKKKLMYRKRKRKEWQEQKKEAKLNSEREHRRIDLWLEKMKWEVLRAKREEDIKREADMVLSNVTTKKSEAKRMLNLLNALAKLRSARIHNSSDQSVEKTGSDVFNQIIDRLKKMWLEQIKGYNVEEQGLKVMLEHAEEERMSVEVAEFRRNLKSWNRCIFGSSNAGLSQSLEELIQISSQLQIEMVQHSKLLFEILKDNPQCIFIFDRKEEKEVVLGGQFDVPGSVHESDEEDRTVFRGTPSGSDPRIQRRTRIQRQPTSSDRYLGIQVRGRSVRTAPEKENTETKVHPERNGFLPIQETK